MTEAAVEEWVRVLSPPPELIQVPGGESKSNCSRFARPAEAWPEAEAKGRGQRLATGGQIVDVRV